VVSAGDWKLVAIKGNSADIDWTGIQLIQPPSSRFDRKRFSIDKNIDNL